jgi:hypothetical protein
MSVSASILGKVDKDSANHLALPPWSNSATAGTALAMMKSQSAKRPKT